MLPRLPELYVSPEAAQGLRADAARLPVWDLDPGQQAELALLAGGGLFPLRGYMTRAEHGAVQADMRLASGALWPLPLALAVSADFAAGVMPGQDVALHAGGALVAILSVTDHWQEGTDLLGGRVKALPQPNSALSPNALRRLFQTAGRVLAEPVAEGLLLRPDLGEPVLLPLPSQTGPGALLWLALVARNHGATHLRTGPEGRALLDRHRAEIGLEALAP